MFCGGLDHQITMNSALLEEEDRILHILLPAMRSDSTHGYGVVVFVFIHSLCQSCNSSESENCPGLISLPGNRNVPTG